METIDKRDSDPLSQFSLSIFRMHGFLLRNGDAITKPVGQSSAKWQVLGRVHYQPQTVADIARSLGNARQSVQRIADVLVQEGLAVFIDNPKDKRARLLNLTPKGEATLTTIYERYADWSRHIMKKLKPSQLASLAQTLNELSHVLETDKHNDE